MFFYIIYNDNKVNILALIGWEIKLLKWLKFKLKSSKSLDKKYNLN